MASKRLLRKAKRLDRHDVATWVYVALILMCLGDFIMIMNAFSEVGDYDLVSIFDVSLGKSLVERLRDNLQLVIDAVCTFSIVLTTLALPHVLGTQSRFNDRKPRGRFNTACAVVFTVFIVMIFLLRLNLRSDAAIASVTVSDIVVSLIMTFLMAMTAMLSYLLARQRGSAGYVASLYRDVELALKEESALQPLKDGADDQLNDWEIEDMRYAVAVEEAEARLGVLHDDWQSVVLDGLCEPASTSAFIKWANEKKS